MPTAEVAGWKCGVTLCALYIFQPGNGKKKRNSKNDAHQHLQLLKKCHTFFGGLKNCLETSWGLMVDVHLIGLPRLESSQLSWLARPHSNQGWKPGIWSWVNGVNGRWEVWCAWFFPLNKKTKCLFGIDSDQPISCAISGVSRASPVDGWGLGSRHIRMQIYQAFSGLNHQPNKEPPTIVEGIWWKQRAEHSGCFFFSLPLLKKWKPDVSPGFYIRLDELQDICEVQVAKSKGWNGLTGWRRGRWFFLHVHPWRLTWNIIMEVWKIIFVSKWVMAVGSMLIFQGCNIFLLVKPWRYFSLQVVFTNCVWILDDFQLDTWEKWSNSAHFFPMGWNHW